MAKTTHTQICRSSVYRDAWYPRTCGNLARYVEDGVHYCGIHAPSRLAARQDAKVANEQARKAKLHGEG